MTEYIIYLGFICSAGFLFLAIMFISGLLSYKVKNSYEKRTVSVCIAARNESDNLRNLLTALVNQTYPTEMYEVVIADDGSEDNSREIVRSFAAKYSFIRLLEVNDRDRVISPKKNALTKAIAMTSGDIILTTDADCIVPPTWIETMVAAFYDESVCLVAGYSRIKIQKWSKASILHKFEYYDFTALYSAVIGSYAWGHGLTCVGQNLAYTRKAFKAVDGFESIKHLISGDDVNLMQTMKKHGLRTIFNFNKGSFVYTNRIMGWKQLINQRSRWAWNLKWQMKLRPIFFWAVFLVLIYYSTIISLIFLDWKWAAIFAGFRFILEMIYLGISFRYLDVESDRIWFYPIWSVLMPILYLITVPMGHFNMFVWYGKKPEKVLRQKRA